MTARGLIQNFAANQSSSNKHMMSNSTSSRSLFFSIIALLLLWLGFVEWKKFGATPVPNQNLISPESTETISRPISSSRPIAQPSQATRIHLPVIGEIVGSKWISGLTFKNPDPLYSEAYIITPEILVDVEGRFLAARAGDDAFATFPTPKRYHEVMGLLLDRDVQHSEAPKALTERVLSVKIKPTDLENTDFQQMLWRITANSGLFKYGLWYHAEVQYEGETQPRTVLIHTWTLGPLSEKTQKLPRYFADIEPKFIPFDSPAIPGANRYGTNVGIKAWQTNGEAGEERYVTEPWAGLSPWKDDEMDPNYGELLPNEFSVPMDRTIDVRFFQDLSSRASRPDIAPEVKARLDREAAEKAAAKNK